MVKTKRIGEVKKGFTLRFKILPNRMTALFEGYRTRDISRLVAKHVSREFGHYY